CSVRSCSRTEPMREQDKLPRRATVARILADRGDMLVVTGLGSRTYDRAAACDQPVNLYLWGAARVRSGVGFAAAAAWRAGDPRRRRNADGYGSAGDRRGEEAGQPGGR